MDPKKPDIPTTVPRTREEFEKALAERKALTTMLVPPKEPAGQAPSAVVASDRTTPRYVEHPRPAAPPAPVVNTSPLEAIRQEKLAAIKAKVDRRQAVKAELLEQQRNSAALIEQMKLDETKLAAESEALEAEVGAIQRELAAVEAQALSAQAAQDQIARGQAANLPLEQWRAQWATAILPLTGRVVAGLGRLRLLLKEKGATLETTASLRSKPGLNNDLRSEFIAVTSAAGQILDDLHEAIRQHERVLVHAEEFVPDPRTPDGRSAINGLRHELESVTGIVTGRLVDVVQPRVLPPSNGIEGTTPSAAILAERVAETLTHYASVQKRVNQVARPEIIITLKPKEKPRHEIMTELRGPKQEGPAGQSHAEMKD